MGRADAMPLLQRSQRPNAATMEVAARTGRRIETILCGGRLDSGALSLALAMAQRAESAWK